MDTIEKKTRKRLTLYFPGYDLRPPRQTSLLIYKELKAFLKLNKVEGDLTPLRDDLDPGGDTAFWEAKVNWPEQTVKARFVQLSWRDVIKPDFERSWPRTLLDGFRSFARFAQAGGYFRVWKSNWAHAIFCLYPAVGLILYVLASLLPPLLLAPYILSLATAVAPPDQAEAVSWAMLLACSGLWMAAVYGLVRLLERKSYFRYLVNSWHFISRLAFNQHPHMLERVEECADVIVAMTEQADADEDVVFVSHSCGTFVAIYILAAVLRRRPEIVHRQGGFAFVTLGPAFDCLGGYGAGHGFGEAMRTVARSGVDWTDLYSPHDPICGGRTPPVSRYALNDTPGEILPEPRRFSICVPDRMSAQQYRYLRRRFFPLHFCYFLASIKPGLFDFYRMTLGPKRATDQLTAWLNKRD